MKLELCEEFFYRIKEESEDIYSLFNSSKENTKRNNENLKFYSGEWVRIKVNDYILHFVKPAETISSIASFYNIEEQQIIKENNLTSNKLFIGQQIKIIQKKPTNN